MNELQVTVNQVPGSITWNFEELKQNLTSYLDLYRGLEYTDETIGNAKKDVAALRKLRTAVDDRKKEIKKKCLEPYNMIELQAKELMKLIDDPITLIDAKVKDYEERRIEAKKKKIREEMDTVFADLPQAARDKLAVIAQDPRWLNATTPDKAWKEGIRKAHDETAGALRILNNVDEAFKDDVMRVYLRELNLTDAMLRAQDLQKQRERVLEQERARQERERQEQERREREMQERERQEAVAQHVEPEQQPAPEPVPEPEPEPTIEANMIAGTETSAEELPRSAPKDGIIEAMIRFRGTQEQLDNAIAHIWYIGAEAEEISK